MEPLEGYDHNFLSLGVEKDQEEQHDMKPTAEEKKDGEVDVQREATQGEAAEERGENGEEGGGGDQVGASTLDPIDHRYEESSGSSSSGDQEQEELNPEEDETGRDQQRLLQHTSHPSFTQLQLRELENYFQYNRSPSRPERREFARCLGVPEARVEVWFKNRRARWRRYQRAQRVRNARRVCPSNPVHVISGAPYCPMYVMRPSGIWLHVQPTLVWPFRVHLVPVVPIQPRAPVAPMPPMPHVLFFPHVLVPSPLIFLPAPPYGLTMFNLVWFPPANIPFVVYTYWY
ncbi:rhox homeobox family member 2 [Fukomys damarensis]|uniref:rhox homeobox family member 2 n=1 Tax=Fukomys damarensis TaxID=885580 RepID=UPI00053FF7B4|nr:rhox homeobox family member 2 [Fukomys damarensis]